MRKSVKYAIFLSLGLLFWPIHAQKLNFKHYGAKAGLPQAQVYSVFQDAKGYLWVGTLSGVARYNGREWTVFTTRQGLIRNQVVSITEDDHGRLYFGTKGSGVSIYDGSTFINHSDDTLMGNSTVNDLLIDEKNRLWVATETGVAIKDDNRIIEYTQKNGLPSQRCLTLFEAHDANIWVGTESGVARYSSNSFTALPELNDKKNISAITQDRDSRVYFASDDGIFVLEQQKVRPLNLDYQKIRGFPNKTGESGVHFTDAIRDSRGGLYFSTEDNGVLKLSDGRAEFIGRKNGLSHNIVLSMAIDYEKNKWFGTDDGLNKLSDGPFAVYDITQGLSENSVRAIFEDKDGTLWLGTRNGITTIKEGHVATPIQASKLSHPRVYSIARHPNGNYLFGTYDGLTVYDETKNSYRIFNQKNGLPLSQVSAILVDSHRQIWLAGDVGIYQWQKDQFVPMVDGRLTEARVLGLIEDQKGNIWAGTRNMGLVQFRPDGTREHFASQFEEAIWDLSLDLEDNLWIGTNGLGAFKYDGKEFTRYTEEQGLTNEFIWNVLCAANGDIWFGHNKGLDRLRNGQISRYNIADGLADNEASATASHEDRNGNLWFGSGKGVTLYNASEQDQDIPPPLVIVEEVTQNGRTIDSGESLDPKMNNVEITYAALSFRNESSVLYQSRLDGLDDEWRATTPRNYVNFNNLGKGNYTFRVKASTNGEQWSEPATFEFSIKPAFYEKLWFQVAVVLVLIAIVIGYHRQRLFIIRRRTVVLENLVMQRTQELATKNEELRQLSLSDALTGLRNRRYLTEMMATEVSSLRRVLYNKDLNNESNKYQFGFMMVDMDHFKRINDTYGHDAGDLVLKKLAQVFQRTVRGSDIVVRWGGEEFLIFLKDLQKGGLGEMARRVLNAVRETEFDIGGGKSIKGTCSIGFAYYPGHSDIDWITWEAVVKLADKGLYIAKESGRNRIYGLGLKQSAQGVDLAKWLVKDLQLGIDDGFIVPIDEETLPS